MGELLVIISEKNDIVYQRMYGRTSNEEYYRLIILIYGSIDTLGWKTLSTNSNYFDCLERHGNLRISVYMMPSGYKSLFIHSKRNPRPFLERIHCVFAAALISSSLEEGVFKSQSLDDKFDEIHKACF
ncbi:ER-Golgi tethering complex TRAPP subunit protein [Encephalitozoon intestinalis ATCC 50506]|uniref:ER-Golgi tethering complex TRAPP subunit protein n=1 Tax=Encephalitozoon intestinalis (strain ATCC 50506) TaxID=876142 RepID=E0S679_ENCIT|nr:ER-Golgi tethering complex TRAPP subunit protein [Encephalitozoon intestinalis ATCC 50506]ADM11214.1 ER-Golgi tethering complex TRAPP subunit protein [Encephalitozoon intestinalis ATCC 50506]UTX44882.1 sedlin [Encephalitozoon intestinalis]